MRSGKYGDSDGGTVGTAITFLMIGIGAGAIAALLFAPKPGKQLRRELRRGYEEAVDTIQDLKEEAMGRVEEVLGRGSELAEELRERAAPLGKVLRRS